MAIIAMIIATTLNNNPKGAWEINPPQPLARTAVTLGPKADQNAIARHFAVLTT